MHQKLHRQPQRSTTAAFLAITGGYLHRIKETTTDAQEIQMAGPMQSERMKNDPRTFLPFKCGSSICPNQRQRLELHEAGLWRKQVVFSSNGVANHIENQLEESFPKLKECGGFEVLRFQGRIDPLRTIVLPRRSYHMSFSKDQSLLGKAIACIRPIQ